MLPSPRFLFGRRLLTVLLFSSFLCRADAIAANPTVQVHHTLTLSFQGPSTSEQDSVNPFTDYRLRATFRQGDRKMVVRGFYSADGNAAHTGSEEGNIWQVRFAPPETGNWSYSVEMRKGADVALSRADDAGEPVTLSDATGRFQVVESQGASQGERDFRQRGGRLGTDGHYFRVRGQSGRLLKVGANSPENLLAYQGFDGTYRVAPNDREGEAKANDQLHVFQPHEKDWRTGDPTWGKGRGKSLIGAVNYLASKGMNSIYFLTMNIGGDGKDVWPYRSHADFTRFDCSKLDQWEIVFEHMQRRGIILHLITQETENERLLDDGDVGRLRQLYYDELIARFAHHPALIWNLGEENGPAPFSPQGQSPEQQKAMSDYLSESDPYGNPVLIHTHASWEHQESILSELLGHASLSGISHQISKPENVHDWILRWRQRSEESGHPWVISMDEIGPYDVGALPDSHDAEHNGLRGPVLWGALTAGASGVEWYFGYKAPHSDLTAEDWRSRDRLWRQTDIAASFFQSHLDYWRMRPSDELIADGQAFCFAEPASSILIYRFQGQGDSSLSIDLSGQQGRYRVRWFDPRRGGAMQKGGIDSVRGGGVVSLGAPPSVPDQDWVLLLSR